MMLKGFGFSLYGVFNMFIGVALIWMLVEVFRRPIK